jgi:uncharacterized membrane protein YsdA (DUF1294 family)/cold shock CspA family protein
MRHQGQITAWKDDRGFGFIAPRGGGEEVFVHITSFADRGRRPTGSELVTYELTADDQGRPQAARVAFVEGGPPPSSRGGKIWPALAGMFLIFLAAMVGANRLPFAVLGLYLFASLATFLAYARDKRAAQTGRWRASESSLHGLALLGGWPGALAAQELLRHKTQKQSFRLVFWATVMLNCLGLLLLFTPAGSEVLRKLLGRLQDWANHNM